MRGLNTKGHWITRFYKNNLKMMLNTQNADLGMANHDIPLLPKWGAIY